MESFALRVQLGNLLTSLNSSRQASIDICNFLIRNYVIQEDLYPAILEVLPKLDINKRLNVFQFLDDFVSMITKDKKYRENDIIYNYAFLIVSDLQKILQCVLPVTPAVEGIDVEDASAARMEIRTLSNLPFCYKIVQHMSHLFGLKDVSKFQEEYNSDLLTDTDRENIQQGILFDESQLYTTTIEPTKSSHVDDYVNSGSASNRKIGADAQNSENRYIPEKINESLVAAWKFLIAKRKQSQYESLLLDVIEDPYNLKTAVGKNPLSTTSSPRKQTNINTNSSLHISVNDILTFKTPSKTPAKTPAKTPGSKTTAVSSSQPSQSSTSENSNILKLSHSLILQRIEADRERQKRGKETSWEIERESGKICISEFEYIYDTLQSYDKNEDKPTIDEMENLYKLCTFTELGQLPNIVNLNTPKGPAVTTSDHAANKGATTGNTYPSSNKNGKYKQNPQHYYDGRNHDSFYNNPRSKRSRSNTYKNAQNRYDDYYNMHDDWYGYNNETPKSSYRYRGKRQ